MSMTKQIDALRGASDRSESERLWEALRLLAQHIDEGDDLDLLGAIFGSD